MYMKLLLIASLPSICLSTSYFKFDSSYVDASNLIYVMDPYQNINLADISDHDKITHSLHQALINKLIDSCGDHYYFVFIPYHNFNTMNNTLQLESFGNFINLFVPDYYKYGSRKFKNLSSIVYAGDVHGVEDIKENVISEEVRITNVTNSSKEVKICDNTHSNILPGVCNTADNHTNFENFTDSSNFTEIPRDCIWRNTSLCNKEWTTDTVNTHIHGVKIVSKAVSEMNSGALFNFITSLYFSGEEVQSHKSCLGVPETLSKLTIVLLCSNDIDVSDNKIYHDSLIFIKVDARQCDVKMRAYKTHLLAVVVAEPFEMEYEVEKVPTIFYKTPYPDFNSQFTNSFNLVPGEILPYAFLKFIQHLGWWRVAIISDDTAYSNVFENILLKKFDEEGIVYNVQRCERIQCNFEQAIKNLVRMDARIVIANVNERNAAILHHAAKFQKRLEVLYRVFRFQGQTENAISITLNLANLKEYWSYPSRDYHTYPPTVNGLGAITYAYKKLNGGHYTLKEYYRLFTETLKKLIKPDLVASVMRVKAKPMPKLLMSMEIERTGIIKKIIEHVSPYRVIPIDQYPCITRTNKFEKPCDISIILLFMFVAVSFFITVLLISCYFDNTSPIHARRYQQL